jgi:S1-C subfamily serine protease
MRQSSHRHTVAVGGWAAIVTVAILACAPRGDHAAPALGVAVDSAFVVTYVQAGSAAHHAGIQVGDVLVALNGTTYTSLDDWRHEVSRMAIGQAYTLDVERGGVVATLTLQAARPPTSQPGPTPTGVPADWWNI